MFSSRTFLARNGTILSISRLTHTPYAKTYTKSKIPKYPTNLSNILYLQESFVSVRMQPMENKNIIVVDMLEDCVTVTPDTSSEYTPMCLAL